MQEPEQSDSGTSEPGTDGNGVPEEIRQFGRYTLVRELGRGAQGVVYLAEDTELHRKVALKMLTGAAAHLKEVRERFHREAELASKLEHPGICGIHEVGKVKETPYIAMQYVQGVTLSEMIEKGRGQRGAKSSGARKQSDAASTLTGKTALSDVLQLVEHAARALHAAHEIGLVHRDIKPGNIMITAEGRPVLLDFGLARDVEDHGNTLTETGQVMGTPAYMSAEQLLGKREEIDAKSDVYSLGATLYECLTFQPPFVAESVDQLYHSILQGAPTNPKQLNPRIPQDLSTVLEVALERDRSRRYESALDLAEDLRRVRSFEPIQAKPAGVLTRAAKWAKRHPAKSVGIAAVVLFALVSTGFLVNQGVARKRAFGEHMRRSEEQLASGDFAAALEAVALAREVNPKSTRAIELKVQIEKEQERAVQEALKQAALSSAAAVREESASKEREYAQVHEAILELEQDMWRKRGAVLDSFAPTEDRGAFARMERDLEQLRLEADRLLLDAREGLNLAARHEAPWGSTPETKEATLNFFLGRWREAVEAGDTVRESLYRATVERQDETGAHAAELLGRGSVQILVEPVDCEMFLFRYESHEKIREGDPIPRLVPVPTSGIGRAPDDSWASAFQPGDEALVILDVEPDSIADRAGLRSGDLVTRIQGEPAGTGVFVISAGTDDALPRSDYRLARVGSLNGVAIERPSDWIKAPLAREVGQDAVTYLGESDEVVCDRNDLRCLGAAELITEVELAADLELTCLRGGAELTLEIPSGQRAGLRCEATAYPLSFSEDNLVQSSAPFEVDPGSYLLVARGDGFESQRFPFVVERLGAVELQLELLPQGTIPPGFVYIPPGKFVYAGDPEARESEPPIVEELGGFFIGRKEVTNREWFAFTDDPETQKKIQASERRIYLPREPSRYIPKENLGGPSTPVMGVSWNDVQDYLAWRNARAEAAGEPWVFDLPSQQEWEKAARGVDGRLFPWGDRFDFANLVGLYRKPHHLYDAPGGLEPRDESPFGLLDTAGHRQEWTRDPVATSDPKAPPMYHWRGGSWRTVVLMDYRSASRGFGTAANVGGNIGFRLVARLRTENEEDQ